MTTKPNLNEAMSAWVEEVSATMGTLSYLLIQKGILTEQEFVEVKEKLGALMKLTTLAIMFEQGDPPKDKNVS